VGAILGAPLGRLHAGAGTCAAAGCATARKNIAKTKCARMNPPSGSGMPLPAIMFPAKRAMQCPAIPTRLKKVHRRPDARPTEFRNRYNYATPR